MKDKWGQTPEEQEEFWRDMAENDRRILADWSRRSTNPFMWAIPVIYGAGMVVFIVAKLAEWALS